MTLQQLKYVVTVARTGSMSEASKELFISQPGLTTSIRELETEMGIKIFTRTNKGVVTSNEGERFLGYARQVLEQASLLEGVYKSGTKIKQQFCVSTQHYSFAVNAFVDLIRRFAGEEYDFSLRETETYEIIDDVAKMKSEIGILYLNSFNKDALMKIIKSKSLTFTELFTAKPHVFVSTDHPLADKNPLQWRSLPIIRISRLNRGSIILSIIRKKFSARSGVQKYQSDRQGNPVQPFNRTQRLHSLQRCNRQ